MPNLGDLLEVYLRKDDLRLILLLATQLGNHLTPGTDHNAMPVTGALLVVRTYLRSRDNVCLSGES